jgi:hypothetical protein
MTCCHSSARHPRAANRSSVAAWRAKCTSLSASDSANWAENSPRAIRRSLAACYGDTSGPPPRASTTVSVSSPNRRARATEAATGPRQRRSRRPPPRDRRGLVPPPVRGSRPSSGCQHAEHWSPSRGPSRRYQVPQPAPASVPSAPLACRMSARAVGSLPRIAPLGPPRYQRPVPLPDRRYFQSRWRTQDSTGIVTNDRGRRSGCDERQTRVASVELMEVSGDLVASPAFKAGGTGDPRAAGSIPVHLRRPRGCARCGS